MRISGAFPVRVVAVLSSLLIVVGSAFAQPIPKNTNRSSKLKSGIVSGAGNLILSNSLFSFIGGGYGNTIGSNVDYAVIPGGFDNAALGVGAAIGGGANNLVEGNQAVVAGGLGNEAKHHYTAVGGGYSNTATQSYGTVAGGGLNNASSLGGFIGGGLLNTASGSSAVVGGGFTNTASGSHSVVPGGSSNVASGYHSFAAGVKAQASHESAFVWGGWGDGATTSTNTNSFTVRAPGGARFITATNLVGAILASGATAWAALSDSNAKTGIEPVQPREILKKVASLPVTSWRYKHDPQRRYIGPMAQDFHEAFGLGADDRTINTLDTDGVTLAAIQGLVEELKERDAQIEALKAGFEAELSEIREQLNRRPPAP